MPRLLLIAIAIAACLAAAGASQAEQAAPPALINQDIGGSGGASPLRLPVLLPSPTATPRPSPTPQPVSSPKYVVVLVLDGGRPDYLTVPNIPHVKALVEEGTTYTNAFDGILESETPAGHASIGTGMVPKHNGIMGFGWENPSAQWVSIFNPAAIDGHVMENLMKNAPSLAGRLHQYNHSAVVAAEGSYKYYANDGLGGPNADITLYYSPNAAGEYAPKFVPGHAPPAKLLRHPELIAKTYKNLPLGSSNHLAMLLASDTFKDTRANVIMLNLPELDYPVGHYDGANRDWKDVTFLMQEFDRDLGMLEDTYRKAGVLNETAFVITADHGFQAIDRFVAPTTVNNAVASSGLRVTHGSYESSDYLWVDQPQRANEAAAAIAKLNDPEIEAVYFKPFGTNTYVRASGASLFHAAGMEDANQLLLQSFAGPNSPDIVVMFRQGTDGVDPSSHWKGDHGGADWESQHIPLILSGPGIQRGRTSRYPGRLVDIAPTILTLMGASSAGMDGRPLADALVHPPAGSTEQQTSLDGRLTRIATAMSTESAADRQAGG